MNAQIRSCIKRGDFQHAYVMFQELCQNSLPVDDGTFLALLKACTEFKDMDKGYNIHTQILARGIFEKHPFIGNTLVNMFAKCGVLRKAQEVFDKLPVRDVVSWNVLLGGLVRHEHAETAIYCFEHMQVEGLSPDAVTYVCMLKACGCIGVADKGIQLHAEIASRGLLKTNIIVVNALLDMYAKCRLPSNAQEVFDNVDRRDTISWNTLMSSYLNNEEGEKALHRYKEMSLNNVPPNAVTFVCGLKACGLARATIEGQSIHEHVSRHGVLEKNLVVGNSLVDMYSKWGWITKAREVFDKLKTRDINSWNALISGYAKLEYGEEALKCLEEMQQDGFVPDAFTYVSSLKACGSIVHAVQGRSLHFEIERRGPSVKNLVVCTAVIDMYAKCGWLAHAQEVFEGLPNRDLVSWNTLIVGYVDYDYGKEALRCLKQMHKEMIPPDSVTFACSLRACGILRMAENGCEIYGEIARKGLPDSDILIGGALVDMYAKCGLVAVAQEVFDKLLVHGAVLWTALIVGYIGIGFGEEALKCFEQMQLEGVFPDGVTLACTLKACGIIGASQQGKALHARFCGTGLLEGDFVAGSVLVDMYARCGLFREAQMAFSCLQARDVASWNTLIAGYTRLQLGVEASKCVKEMRLQGIVPDIITLLCNLRGSFDVGTTNEAKKILDENVESFEGDLFLCNTLVDIYAKSGDFSKALELFYRLPAREVITWNALISGFVKHEHNEEALDCLQQMQAEGIFPDDITFVSSLKACSSSGATGKGRELHAEIARRGLLGADISLCNALVDMYAKSGWLGKAEEVFNHVTSHDVISWNILISGYSQLGDNESVLALLDKMRNRGEKPDAVTFVSVLRACSQAVLVERGHLIFNSMCKNDGIIPTLEHYTCMISLYARTGGLHQAISTIVESPYDPDFVVWLTLLDACRRLGVVYLGQEAHIYTLHPKRFGAAALPIQSFPENCNRGELSLNRNKLWSLLVSR